MTVATDGENPSLLIQYARVVRSSWLDFGLDVNEIGRFTHGNQAYFGLKPNPGTRVISDS
jgi:hypothetical protein